MIDEYLVCLLCLLFLLTRVIDSGANINSFSSGIGCVFMIFSEQNFGSGMNIVSSTIHFTNQRHEVCHFCFESAMPVQANYMNLSVTFAGKQIHRRRC